MYGLISWLANLVWAYLPEGGVVGILELAYKPNTDVVEESVGMLLAGELGGEGQRLWFMTWRGWRMPVGCWGAGWFLRVHRKRVWRHPMMW